MILHHKILGSGPPLMILHGLFGMLDNWKTMAGLFSSDFKVILVDQRNHGRSFHSVDMSYDKMSTDLRNLMDELNLAKVHLVGHSMGGKTAMRFAQNHPERCHTFTSVDIAPKKYKGGHESLFNAILKTNLKGVTRRKEVEDQLDKSIGDKQIRLFLLKNLMRTEEGFEWRANFQNLHLNYTHLLGFETKIDPPCDVPCLFVKGCRSEYIASNDEVLIKKLFPKAQFVEIMAGHWIHAEKPIELKKIINDFVRNSL